MSNATLETMNLDAIKAICDHNEGCYQACGMTTQHDYVRDARPCAEYAKYNRTCSDCPQDWLIEWPVGSGQFARRP